MIDPRHTWKVQYKVRSNRSKLPTSPNTALARQNDIDLLVYSTLPSSTLLYSTLLVCTLLYSTLLYSTLLYSALRCSALLYSTLLFSSLLCSTILFQFQKSITRKFIIQTSFDHQSILLHIEALGLRNFHKRTTGSEMLALPPGMPISYKYFGVLFFTTWKRTDSVHVRWSFSEGCDFCKKGGKRHEEYRTNLTPIESYCSDTTVEQLRLDPILLRSWVRRQWCRQMCQKRLRPWFGANPKSRAANMITP